jgi:hypothetical protein
MRVAEAVRYVVHGNEGLFFVDAGSDERDYSAEKEGVQ